MLFRCSIFRMHHRIVMCGVQSARTSCGSLSFESPRRILNHSYFCLQCVLILRPRPIIVSSIDAEKIYIHLEIFHDIISLCRQDLRPPFRTCVHSLCRLTFINYCLRRERMRSHKSNRALFVSLSAYVC